MKGNLNTCSYAWPCDIHSPRSFRLHSQCPGRLCYSCLWFCCRHLYCKLKANGYLGNFVRSINQPKNAHPRPGENSKAYASVPYFKGVSAGIRRILNGENSKTAFKPLKSGAVYKVSCRRVPLRVFERVKEVGSPGGLNTSLERMGRSAPR